MSTATSRRQWSLSEVCWFCTSKHAPSVTFRRKPHCSNMARGKLSWMIMLMIGLLGSCEGARILGIIPMAAKSHNIVLSSLLKELAARNHQVTVLTFLPQEKPLPNYKDIVLDQGFFQSFGNSSNMYEMRDMNSFQKILMLWIIGNVFAENILQQPDVQKLIHSKDQQFDVIILESFFNEALLGFAHKFKAPTIAVCPFGGTHWMGYMVGSPSPFSYVPDIFLNYGDHMTFVERLHNTIVGLFGYLGHELFYIPKQDAIMQKYFNYTESLPPLSELKHNISALLVNTHVSLTYPRPLVPNMVQVGGMHIKPAKELPKDLKKFLDEAKDGVIYFSMGSHLQSAMLPDEKCQAILSAFGKLKQKVLWKWENDTLPGLPPNVQFNKWYPQTEIMAHPNVRLFITHGGLLGTQEAIHNGVPLIGIPIFGDQELNMHKAVSAGYGLLLDYYNLTSVSLSWAINEVLNEPSYKANAKRLSGIFRDQPVSAMDRAVYWVEYVLRHQGAPHLRSAALDLTWYQYFLLDVIAVLLGGAIFVVLLFYMCVRAVFRKLCSRSGKQQDQKKKLKKK